MRTRVNSYHRDPLAQISPILSRSHCAALATGIVRSSAPRTARGQAIRLMPYVSARFQREGSRDVSGDFEMTKSARVEALRGVA
jgi:hypothetical protein